MSRSLAGALTLVAALSLSLLGAVPAFAVTAPAPNTTECTNLVNAQSAVATLQGSVNTAVATLAADQAAGATPATIVNDTTGPAGVQTLTAQLAVLRSTTSQQLCTGTTGSTATTTPATPHTVDPTSPPVFPRTRPEAVIAAEIDALSCASTNADLQLIDRQIAARQAAHQSTGIVVPRLNDKLASLSCSTGALTSKAAAATAQDCHCVTETTVTEAPAVVSTRTVSPLADDGSTPALSGSQVSVAPSGSASTGAA